MAPILPSDMKVSDLRKELSARNLSTKGVKKELVERLEEALQQSGESVGETGDDFDLLPTEEQPEEEAATSNAEQATEEAAEAMDTEEHAPEPTATEGDLKRKLEDDDEDQDMGEGKAETTGGDAPMAESTSTNGDGCPALYIKNLERPLTTFRMHDLLDKFGAVKDLRLNAIKTRCYVLYTNGADAQAAFSSVSGSEFPPGRGKQLECGFLTESRFTQLVSQEERSQDSVGSLDLITVSEENGNCGVWLDKPGSTGRKSKKQKREERAEKRSTEEAANGKATQTGETRKQSKWDNDPRVQWTKAKPSVMYRLPTDEEIAARKAQQSTATNA